MEVDYTKINQAMELSEEFKAGAKAFIEGKMPSQNPWSQPYAEYYEWLDGWEESFYADNYRKENK